MKDNQLSLFDDAAARPSELTQDRSSTFVDNMRLPIHRWFRYSAGFSAQWVDQEIESALKRGQVRLVDPFAGAGTTLIEAERRGVESKGIEAHPFVFRIAQAKLAWRTSTKEFLNFSDQLVNSAKKQKSSIEEYPELIKKCYPEGSLQSLDKIRRAWLELNNGKPAAELVWLAINGILRACSPVGTAQWQYILPKKEKAGYLDPFNALQIQIDNMAADIQRCNQTFSNQQAKLTQDDARECKTIPDNWANLVITSPPYTNNYDYADATRLEMSFWQEIAGWGDLQDTVRKHLIRSCTQHVSADGSGLGKLLEDPDLEPIRDEVRSVCSRLAEERMNHGGKKPYHLMVAAYFRDLAKVWKSLRRITDSKSTVCFVVGDSAPYGIYVPVDRWLGELAVSAGFLTYRFDKTRDRNTKWKNRKHRVPLHEGRLWVEG